MRKRYTAQWRRAYRRLRRRRLNEEALTIRTERSLTRTLRAALRGDPEAFVKILKLTGELPQDYKLSD